MTLVFAAILLDWGPQGALDGENVSLIAMACSYLGAGVTLRAIRKEQSWQLNPAPCELKAVTSVRKELNDIIELFDGASRKTLKILKEAGNNLDCLAAVQLCGFYMLYNRDDVEMAWVAAGRTEAQISASFSAAERACNVVDEHSETLKNLLSGPTVVSYAPNILSSNFTGQELEAAALTLVEQTEQAVAALTTIK